MAVYTVTTKAEFEAKVLQSDMPVLVDFGPNWCAPCRAMAPILHDVAAELDGTVDIVKVDIEKSAENQALAGEYGVQSIPNMPIFHGGVEVERLIGMAPKAHLVEMLKGIAATGA